ncbi:MAG: aminotransferase class IV, partial [Anaerolineales bacterium]
MSEVIVTARLTPQGLQETAYQASSLHDAAQHEPDGVYTVTRTFERDKALYLDAHLDRLEDSAQQEHIALTLDRGALRAALRALIDCAGYPEARFRITVPRQDPATLYLALEPLPGLPPNAKTEG